MSEENEIYRESYAHLFNKLNGIHVFSIQGDENSVDLYDPRLFHVRYAPMSIQYEILEGQLHIAEDGTITDDWKIVLLTDRKQMVMERSLNMAAETKITGVYPIATQINILSRAIKKIAEAAGVETEELDEMVSYIEHCIATNQIHKEFYRGSEDVEYVTDESVAAHKSRAMEGGIHEWLGARPVTGGRIFGSDS